MTKTTGRPRGAGGGAQLWLIFGVTVALGAVSFALQNGVPVTVTFLFFRFDSSLAMVLLLAFGLGVVTAALLSWPVVLRERWALSRERRRAAALEGELRQVRRPAEKVIGGEPEDGVVPSLDEPPTRPPAA